MNSLTKIGIGVVAAGTVAVGAVLSQNQSAPIPSHGFRINNPAITRIDYHQGSTTAIVYFKKKNGTEGSVTIALSSWAGENTFEQTVNAIPQQ